MSRTDGSNETVSVFQAHGLINSNLEGAAPGIVEDLSGRAVEAAESLEHSAVVPRTIRRRVSGALPSLRAISTRVGRALEREEFFTDPARIECLIQTIEAVERASGELNDPNTSEAQKTKSAHAAAQAFAQSLAALGGLVSDLAHPLGRYGSVLEAMAPEFLNHLIRH